MNLDRASSLDKRCCAGSICTGEAIGITRSWVRPKANCSSNWRVKSGRGSSSVSVTIDLARPTSGRWLRSRSNNRRYGNLTPLRLMHLPYPSIPPSSSRLQSPTSISRIARPARFPAHRSVHPPPPLHRRPQNTPASRHSRCCIRPIRIPECTISLPSTPSPRLH